MVFEYVMYPAVSWKYVAMSGSNALCGCDTFFDERNQQVLNVGPKRGSLNVGP